MKPKDAQELLTPAQYSVFRELVLRGSTSQEIGKTLGLSTYTVSNHLRSIFEACGVNSRTALMAKVLVPHLPVPIVKAFDVVLPAVYASDRAKSKGPIPANTLSRSSAGKKAGSKKTRARRRVGKTA